MKKVKLTKGQIEKIEKMRIKRVSVDEAVAVLNKISPGLGTMNEKNLIKAPDGELLMVYENRRYVLQKVFIRPFTLNYSAHKDIKVGREVFISSFRLPKLITPLGRSKRN